MLILDLPEARAVHTLAFAPDGRTLAGVQGRAHHIALWDLTTREPTVALEGHTHRVVALAFDPSGDRLASATFAGEIRVWFRVAGSPLKWASRWRLDWPRNTWLHAPGQLRFSPDGEVLATTQRRPLPDTAVRWRRADEDTSVSLIRLGDERVPLLLPGKEHLESIVTRITRHREEVSCLAFAPDGRTLATGSFDRTVRLHSLKGGQSHVHDQGQKVHYLAFSPDGTTLASGSPSGMVRLWDAASGDRRATVRHAPPPLHALCYSPDGQTLATVGGGTQGAVCFWDVATASRRSAFDWRIGELHSVAFADDGMRAAAGGMGKVVVWDVDGWEQ